LPKTEFTSFDTAAVVRELKETIADSRVSNVYQLDAKTLLLKLHRAGKPDLRLVLEAGRRLHLTAYAVEKPLVPPGFCMALRKYLRESWLETVEQHEFERIIVFGFKTKFGTVRLILELFGDGNVILVDERGAILQALSYKRMRDRNILRGEAFSFPPSTSMNPLKISREQFAEGLKAFADVGVVRAVARLLGIGGIYAEEVLLRVGVDKARTCVLLSDVEVSAVFDELQKMLSQVTSGELQPCVVLDENESPADVVPFRLRRYEGFGLQSCTSFNEALDDFFTRAVALEKGAAATKVDELKREAERLKRIISEQEKTLADAEGKADHDKRIGDAIYARMGELQTLLDRFATAKRHDEEWKTVVTEALAEKKTGLAPSLFFESFDSKGLMVNVLVDGIAFGLELQRTLFENAARYYERGKRAKQKLAGAKTALEESRKKLAEADHKIREAESLEHARPAETVEKLAKLRVKHKEWFEKFRWFVSSDGSLVVAGKDAVSNEVLIKKHTEKDDTVFHADIAGAPFVVVKTEGKKPSEQTLKEAGEFAAAFSRGWREGFGSVDVYWVKPEQLSKGGPSGEHVTHGAFVVIGQRNWIRNVPLRTAVGIAMKDGDVSVVGGPVDAVEPKTEAHVVVVPGDVSGKELFRRILHSLTSKMPADLRGKMLKTSTEELRDYVPYSKGRTLAE
jgi:predicted ribosome quality control (RQC) complex YloA/Tae2 family protein